jgi:MFS transporter, FSR family, fosmidomycin resistance protein
VFGVREAAWPFIRTDLGLSYQQIGLLLAVPGLVSSLLEPALGILGDSGRRRSLVLAGGAGFALALLLVGWAPDFGLLLVGFLLLYPASGAFVSLSQATLMDREPDAHERNMARWVAAGSIGVVAGPLLLSGSVALGAGWRSLMIALAVVAVLLVLAARSTRFDGAGEGAPRFAAVSRDAVRELRNPRVLRWLVVIEVQDLMVDVLFGFLALYFVDVVGTGGVSAGLAVGVWTGAGLVGNAGLLWLLSRMPGLSYLRWSALAVAVVFPAFLLVPGLGPKLVLLATLAVLTSGWYAIPQGQLYSALPGRSGTALALSNVSGLFGSLFPLAIGTLAARVGLGPALWVCLLAPIVMVFLAPRQRGP